MRHSSLFDLLKSAVYYCCGAAACGFVLIPVSIGIVVAQESEEVKDARVLEEIIVTASRRNQVLSEVAMSITAVMPDEFLERGLTSLQDLMAYAPSVVVEDRGAPGLTQISMRGVASNFQIPTVGIYVDDFPIGSNTGFAVGALFTLEAAQNGIERIEVLRGPQGTLYGASAMGGLLKYVTKQPSTAGFEGSILTDLSSTKDGGFNQIYRINMNVPVAKDTFAISVNAFYDDREGFIDEAVRPLENVNASEFYGGSIRALWTPTQELSIKLQYMGQRIEHDNQGRVDFDPVTGDYIYGPRIKNDQVDTPQAIDFDLFGLAVDYDFDWAMLTIVASTQESTNNSIQDLTAPFAGLIDLRGGHPPGTTQLVSFDTGNVIDRDSYEVRLASPDSDEFEWVAGLFYTDENSVNRQDVTSDPNPSGVNLLTLDRLNGYEEFAAFANVTYYINPDFDLNVGARYSDNRAIIQDAGSGIIRGGNGFDETAFGQKDVLEDTVDTYLFTARYRPSDDVSFYGRIASGYRPGGKNPFRGGVSGDPLGSPFFASDSLWSYEIGTKGTSQDGRFFYEVAGFLLDWNDQQIVIVRDGIGAASNAVSGVTSLGIETAFGWMPMDGLMITGTLSYVDSTLDGDEPDLQGVKGESLIDVPKWSGSLRANYDFPVGKNFDGFVGGSATFVGKKPAAFSGSAIQYTVPDFTVVGLQGGIGTGRYSISLYVNNLLDSNGFQHVTLGGRSTAAITRPRTIGAVLTLNF